MELLLIPLAFTLISLFVPKQTLKYLALTGAAASLVAGIIHLVSYCSCTNFVTIFNPGIATMFGLTLKMGYDGMALVMILLTNAIIPLIVLSNFDKEIGSNRKFVAMVFLMQFALLGVFTALDGLLFYVFWEITLIPVFLIALWFGAAERKKALMKFFIYTFVGSLGMLAALMTIKVYSASFAYEDLVAAQFSAKTAYWIMGGFFLAFAIKIPLFPFHTWQPETYTISPMGGTMLLSALMLKMAFFGMIRWMIPLAPEALDGWLCIGITMALIGIVYAAIMAIKQEDIKRIFALASISHVGLIAAGVLLWNKDSLSAVFLQMINHSLVAVGLFLAAGILEDRTNTRNLYELGGVAKLAPKFGFWFAVIGFASVSVPFSSGFIGEFLLLKELYSYQWIIGLVAGTTLVFGAVYTLRAYQLSMFGAPKLTEFRDLSWNEWAVFFIIGILVLALGLFPQYIFNLVGPSIDHLMETVNSSQIILN
ncbi:MAG: hypothetical protein K0R65_1108 [Crocinitomicaceae bacterium]|nr:hypothetical protein [Crocinitomicaceae bacterium]